MTIKLFADGANIETMIALAQDARISGFTTNPTLLRQAGVTEYLTFARDVVAAIPGKSISFEVIADDFHIMDVQARGLAALGPNVYVKIPITNTRGESSATLIKCLSLSGVKVNVTAVMTLEQSRCATESLTNGAPAILSIFAGRIADTGCDPQCYLTNAQSLIRSLAPQCELLWASPREVLNVYQAERIGCDIITLTPDLLKKLDLYEKDLTQYSLETVQMFYRDAQAAGLTL